MSLKLNTNRNKVNDNDLKEIWFNYTKKFGRFNSELALEVSRNNFSLATSYLIEPDTSPDEFKKFYNSKYYRNDINIDDINIDDISYIPSLDKMPQLRRQNAYDDKLNNEIKNTYDIKSSNNYRHISLKALILAIIFLVALITITLMVIIPVFMVIQSN